jgi:phosphopantothenoylcysteine synthetase/decarboxylase
MPRHILITCGPSYEPIDEVRRITNHSTGELGITLANRLARDGWEVECFIGAGATCRSALAENVRRTQFSTNEDLLRKLAAFSHREDTVAVFHAAALCDFRVKQVVDASGGPVASAKIPTRGGEITLVLEPAPKVLAQLRGLFPRSRIVGWKYELAGEREEVVRKGRAQLAENGTDLCVLNGSAYGLDFGVLALGAEPVDVRGKAALSDWLTDWVANRGRA